MSTARRTELGPDAPTSIDTTVEVRATALDRFTPEPRGPRQWARAYTRYYMPVLTLVALGGAWEFAVGALNIPRFILPPPSRILEAALQDYHSLWQHTIFTLSSTLTGFGIAIAVSLPLAIMVVYSRLLRDTVFPLILFTQAVPKVAVAPVFLLALGYGQASKVVIAFLVCFFPIVINTAAGLESLSEERLVLARSLCASEVDIFTKFRFPTALPIIFVGLKLGVTLAVIGAVVGEFVGSDRGLGYLILVSTANARSGLAFAAILALAVLSIVLFYAVTWVERLMVPWASRD